MPPLIEREIRVDKLFREFTVQRSDINQEKRTVSLSFSSEDPVERWFGMEILDHSPGAADLNRLKRAGTLLIDHSPKDQIGIIEDVTIGQDRKGRAVVRYGKGVRASEIFQDVVDGIRKNISVGYFIKDMILESRGENAPDVYRVTKWEPFEISHVSIPADITVGIGRGEVTEGGTVIKVKIPETMQSIIKREEIKMEKCKTCSADLIEGKCQKCDALAVAQARSTVKSADEMEKNRKKAIENLCKANKLDDKYREMFIGQGLSLEQVSEDILTILEERGKTNPQPASRLGLTEDETQRFSLSRAILACSNKDWSKAGFELEASRTIAQKLNRTPDPQKFFVPFEVLERDLDRRAMQAMKRDVSTAASGGGYLVQTDNVGFVEMLRNRSVAFRMGARRLSGLVGGVMIPKQSAAGTAYWLTNEATQITESQQTFVQVALTPKNVGAYTEISRQLLLQSSPGVEGIVTDDLAQQVALAADLAVIAGTGTAQPQGIIGTSGVGSVTGTTMAYAGIIEFQTDIATSNVTPVRGGYVGTPVVAGLLIARSRFANTDTPLWDGNIWDGKMAGFPAMSSNQVPTGDLLFGDWNEVVVGEWGVLEVDVNPFANFQAGIIGVRAIYSMDVGVRRGFAFSLATSVT